jgi:hypothetical protein
LLEEKVRGKKLREGKAKIPINFPLFGCSRKLEGKKNITIGPTKILSLRRKFGTSGIFCLFQIYPLLLSFSYCMLTC